jgi:hypothetical protein
MSWSKLGERIAGYAPLLGAVIGGPAGALGAVVASVFGAENNPDDILRAVNKDPEAAIKLRKIEAENKQAIEKDLTKRLAVVNKTMQVESQSADPFVRRWRPFYGYCVAISWLIQIVGITFIFGYTALVNPDKLTTVIQQFAILSGSLISLWGIALAVLGVSVHKRSKDKENGAK